MLYLLSQFGDQIPVLNVASATVHLPQPAGRR